MSIRITDKANTKKCGVRNSNCENYVDIWVYVFSELYSSEKLKNITCPKPALRFAHNLDFDGKSGCYREYKPDNLEIQNYSFIKSDDVDEDKSYYYTVDIRHTTNKIDSGKYQTILKEIVKTFKLLKEQD